MTESTVRPAHPGDASSIRRVARSAWHAVYDDLLGPERVEETVDRWYDTERLVADDITPDERLLLVAVSDHETTGDRVVGFAEAVPEEADLARLYRLYVDPDRWRAGVGSALLDRIEARLRERAFERLRLTVLATNEVGVGFYEARGFERTATAHNEAFDAREYTYRKRL